MSILVVGSVAFDSIQTPSGTVDRCLGGAATHFALAASFFTKVRVIGVVEKTLLPRRKRFFAREASILKVLSTPQGKAFTGPANISRI